jgi:hypothetical protein
MRYLIALILLIPFAARAQDKGDELEACRKGQAELAAKAAEFQGDRKIKRLIEFDLKRAHREEWEGDASECLEAIEHANKLISGDY